MRKMCDAIRLRLRHMDPTAWYDLGFIFLSNGIQKGMEGEERMYRVACGAINHRMLAQRYCLTQVHCSSHLTDCRESTALSCLLTKSRPGKDFGALSM